MENEKVVRMEENIKQTNKRLEVCDKKIEKLEETYSIMSNLNYRMENVEKAVESIDHKLDQHKDNKGKKWDKLIEYIFYTVLAYILLKLGIKG